MISRSQATNAIILGVNQLHNVPPFKRDIQYKKNEMSTLSQGRCTASIMVWVASLYFTSTQAGFSSFTCCIDTHWSDMHTVQTSFPLFAGASSDLFFMDIGGGGSQWPMLVHLCLLRSRLIQTSKSSPSILIFGAVASTGRVSDTLPRGQGCETLVACPLML